jgi:RNA polymerase sigma-70 factor (ECF subfamily)
LGPSDAAAGPELDASALEALYSRLETPIYNVVYRYLWDREEAHDIVQEAFVRLWNKRRSVRMQTVEPFVYRIALNLAMNRRRDRRVRRLVPLDAAPELSGGPTAAVELEARQRQERVRRSVDALPPDLRQVVLLTEMSELTYKQVGEVVGIPEGTVGSRRHKALAILRETLAGEA